MPTHEADWAVISGGRVVVGGVSLSAACLSPRLPGVEKEEGNRTEEKVHRRVETLLPTSLHRRSFLYLSPF